MSWTKYIPQDAPTIWDDNTTTWDGGPFTVWDGQGDQWTKQEGGTGGQ